MTCRLILDRPWMLLEFDTPQRVLSWALNCPGFVKTKRLIWREVRNADLPRDLDVKSWLETELSRRSAGEAVAFLTSRDIRAVKDETAVVDGVAVRCVATVGLSNAERVGCRVDRTEKDWGTINLAVIVETGLTDAARLEALSIATQARTLAVLAAGLELPGGLATGTGTDCIAIAAPAGNTAYAGLHTSLGEATGQAVLRAVGAGVAEWMQSVRRESEA